jgi:hypothetical protein
LELKPEPGSKQDLVLESELEPKLDSRIKTGSDFLIVDFIGKMSYERCEDELEQFVYEGKNKHITQRVSAYQIDEVSYKSA